MVEYALQCVFLHLAWSCKRTEGDEEAFMAKRDRAVEIFAKLAVSDRTNAIEVVKRQVSELVIGLTVGIHLVSQPACPSQPESLQPFIHCESLSSYDFRRNAKSPGLSLRRHSRAPRVRGR
jgi:hypothetical protein